MEIKHKFTNSLLKIYNLDIINYFVEFLSGEQAVLFSLYINEGTNPSFISEKLNITKSRMSSITKSLIKKDYIEVKKDKLDKRKSILLLKPKGKTFIQNKETTILNIFNKLYEKMGEKKILKLSLLLEEVANTMDEVKL